MALTNNLELYQCMARLRSHGITRDPQHMTFGPLGPWYYEQLELGYNYRMTDLQAALGISQLKKLSRFIDRRNEIADRYRALLSDLPLTLPPAAPEGFQHGYHLFPIRVADRKRVFDGLREKGIDAQVHYVPAHHHPISSDLEQQPGDLPACDSAYEQLLSLPIYPGLTTEQQGRVVGALRVLLGP